VLARAISYTTLGLDAVRVFIEVDAVLGLPALTIVGLPDQAVRESRERVRSAVLNSQFHLPSQRFTINLAPADIKKEGGSFDLAIALGLLAASHQLDPAAVESVIALGELALDGAVRPVRGVLPIALGARRTRRPLLVPAANAPEAALVDGLRVVPVRTLTDAAAHLSGASPIPSYVPPPPDGREGDAGDADFADVKGQPHARRALEVASAGGHHVLLIGPPGSGKTLLAQRLPGILPPWTPDEALETSAIHSVAGALDGEPLLARRPFRAPHHTSSAIALIGGGPVPRPGEVSLAHAGVLFLDELPEFPRHVLETLRQPLEEGRVRLARVRRSVTFPSRFMLIAAMNPCPCGYLTDARGRCRCPSTQIQRYLARVSGPLLDRIDLHVDVPALPPEVLQRIEPGESSEEIRRRVAAARARQRARLAPLGLACNAELRPRHLRKVCALTAEAERLLHAAVSELGLSARAYDKILRLGRTIADLAASEGVHAAHIAEAVQYRSLDRTLWV